MSDRAALISAILNNLADDTPRLVFADYLQENGEVERAEFIRLQIEAAKLPKAKRAASKPGIQAEKLREKHDTEWRAAHDLLPHNGKFHRGLLTEVWFYAGEFAGRAAALLSVEPATFVLGLDSDIDGQGTEAALAWVDRLAANPHLKAVARIYSQNGDWGAKRFARLMRSPHLGHLKAVQFFEDVIGLAGVKAIADSPSQFVLTDLELNESLQSQDDDESAATVKAVRLIATSPRFASLKHLGLTFNGLGDRSVEALLASTTLPKSLHLEIFDNPCEDDYSERLEERFGGGVPDDADD